MNAFLNALRRMFRSASRPSAPRGARLRLEALEDRMVPSTVGLADSGQAFEAFAANSGLYGFSTGGGWQQLTTATPNLIAVNNSGEIAAAFGSNGLWRFEHGWQKLTTASPSLIAIDNVGNVAAVIPGGGLYLFQDGSGWQRLTVATPNAMAMDVEGGLVGAFGSLGVWAYNAGWHELTSANASAVAIDKARDVAAAVPGGGLWVDVGSKSWEQVATATPNVVAINATGGLAGVFGSAGLWLDYRGWRQLTPASPSQIAINSSGAVAGDFGDPDLWLHTLNGWQELSNQQGGGGGHINGQSFTLTLNVDVPLSLQVSPYGGADLSGQATVQFTSDGAGAWNFGGTVTLQQDQPLKADDSQFAWDYSGVYSFQGHVSSNGTVSTFYFRSSQLAILASYCDFEISSDGSVTFGGSLSFTAGVPNGAVEGNGGFYAS